MVKSSSAGPNGAAALAAAWMLLAPSSVRAERLPLQHYTSEHGLPSEEVRSALRDSRGLLWFGTSAGLVRFDGHAFRVFGRDRGLEDPSVISIAEEEDGCLLVGTTGRALYRFDMAAGGSFSEILQPPPGAGSGIVMLRDPLGPVWVGRDGLYKVERNPGGPALSRVGDAPPEVASLVLSLAVDAGGDLWIGSKGLHVLSRDGRFARVELPEGFEWVASLAADAAGQVWAAARQGVCIVDPAAAARSGRGHTCHPIPSRDEPILRGARLMARMGGGVWAGNGDGFVEAGRDGTLLRRMTRAKGLAATGGIPLTLDGTGNPWFAADMSGIMRLSLDGFDSFRAEDGLVESRIGSILRTRSGDLIVWGRSHVLQRFEAGRLDAVRPDLKGIYGGWGWHQSELLDSEGDWWIPTGEGILRYGAVRRFRDLAGASPKAIYTTKDGLPSDDIFRLFEDGRGDIWVGTLYAQPAMGPPMDGPTLSRWERATGRFHRYGAAQGVVESVAPTAFVELPDGSLWIGFSEEGEVYRYRGGTFQRLGSGGGFAGALVSAFFLDGSGSLWISTRGAGVCRVDEPVAANPSCARITARDGLASDEVNGIGQDDRGLIYLGTSRGVDVLEGARLVRHLDTVDGLPHRYVNVVFDDPDGPIWFGTLNGLARLVSRGEPLRRSKPPGVRIDGLRVAGVPRPLSALGEKTIPDLVLSPSERRLQIDFMGLSVEEGGPIAFQHRLDAEEPWSEPTTEPTVHFPDLAPGRYRFEVRAINAAGPSPEPAVVAFRVLAPFWMRPWFAGLVLAVLTASVYGAYRVRVARLVALERQRMRIAMDLHDELGSGLGSIGVLADLAADDGMGEPRRRELLDQVASTASELGASMGEIVRSLQSGSETIESLARRLSERGRRLFPGGGPALRTSFPSSWPEVPISLPVRHNLAMIGLEALHNAARHSAATEVRLELVREGGRWRLSVSDNGRGVVAGGDGTGTGMAGMRRRAEEIGAELRVESREGEGTTVTVQFDPWAGGKTPLV